ncbi:MAG: sulfate adenylyltransferase [Halobacteriales archaeon]|nr:sulfate adenylyltransferase [Halobacteriales archaeon]
MVSEPHGGTLVDLTTTRPDGADDLPRLRLTDDEYMDLEMLGTGAYSPLDGFMTRDDFDAVLDEARLDDGTPWSLPVVLSADNGVPNEKHALVHDDVIVGAVDVEETWEYDDERWAREVLGTTDDDHPGVQRVRSLGETLVGGNVELYVESEEAGYERRYTPRESREEFEGRGWRSVVGFQTRNPPHRAHEYLQKCALETVDGLFVQPLVGSTKEGDVDPGVRMRAYDALLDGYYAAERVVLGTLKTPMRYAGPREALFHALVRQNYGCTHFVIGRDHAGVKDYYGGYDAHDFLLGFEDEIGVTPLYYDFAFYCHACDGMATEKTCGHDDEVRENPSGTYIRQTAREGGEVSEKLMRPEVWEIVREELVEEASGREAEAKARTAETRTGTGGSS